MILKPYTSKSITANNEVVERLQNNINFIGSFEESTIAVSSLNQTYTDRESKRVNYIEGIAITICDLSNKDDYYDKVYIIDNELKSLTHYDLNFIDLLAQYSELINISYVETLKIQLGVGQKVEFYSAKKLVIYVAH